MDLLAQLLVEPLGAEVPRPHFEQVARQSLLGDIREPVAVGEAQENLQRGADVAAEARDGLLLVDLETRHGADDAVGHHQHRRLVQMGEHAEQFELVPELRVEAALRVGENGFGGEIGRAHV